VVSVLELHERELIKETLAAKEALEKSDMKPAVVMNAGPPRPPTSISGAALAAIRGTLTARHAPAPDGWLDLDRRPLGHAVGFFSKLESAS
jgi:hypothetical protein